MSKKVLAIVSPLGIIAICSITAVLLYKVMGRWVFIPVFILYWSLLFFVTVKGAGISGIKRWLQKPSNGRAGLVLSVIVGFIPFPILLTNLHILSLPLILLSIPIVVLNPFFEELYWRGFVLDFTFPSKALSSLYSSILFILSHLLIWGVFSYGNRSYFLIGTLAIMSATYCIVRLKTKSLWWCIISHFFVDTFNLVVFVMLNIYIPEHGYIPAMELLFGAIK
jgi:membrane protease YdiL (CAAX protease family)